ncbi:MAG: hypothetical protein EOR11_10250, partial [Mesorhizobium sp.]
RKRRPALTPCFYAIPDGKPFHTFPGIAPAAANHPHSGPSGHLSPCPGERKSRSHAWRLSSPPSSGSEVVCEAGRSGGRQHQEASS